MIGESQSIIISAALEAAAISGLYRNKVEIITAVVETTGAPRPTVRRVKSALVDTLKAKVRILEE